MKTYINKSIILLVLLITASAIVSCDKLDKNGALDGSWQLTTLQRKADGVVTADKNSRIYYYFKLDLMELRQVSDTMYYLARFQHIADSLIIGPVYQSPYDSLVAISTVNEKFGIDDGRMHIINLTHNSLILENKRYKINFRKF